MLRFEEVTYTYPHQDAPAVRDVSLAVRPGEVVLCTGASGCGKSTLIRLANGLCPHYFQGTLQGRVLVDGRPTTERGIAELARVTGTLFQDPEQQFFALNVEDELAFALEWRGMAREDMREAVDRAARDFGLLGLPDLRTAALANLSEGQKQKVGLAALCAQNPAALILDEPSANLDPEATRELAHKLLELKRQGMAIFVVDHRLYWLEGIADRVVVMREGRVVAQGGFDLLRDEELRQSCGLRTAWVPDVRRSLPSVCGQDARRSLPSVGANDVRKQDTAGNSAPLSVVGLTHAHKDNPPLYENAAFSLPSGITALLGANGTGKTTLARLLTGLHKPDSGSVALGGVALPEKERLRCSGLVLQNADHQLHMRTVLEEVETCLAPAEAYKNTSKQARREAHRAEALRLLELFHMGDLAERHPQSLSGGQKQRLVIACALARRPQLLVLDEPTSGLDGRNMEKMAAVLQDYAAAGGCVLLITHDLELLHRICARALCLPLA